jgi:hypothetical protein
MTRNVGLVVVGCLAVTLVVLAGCDAGGASPPPVRTPKSLAGSGSKPSQSSTATEMARGNSSGSGSVGGGSPASLAVLLKPDLTLETVAGTPQVTEINQLSAHSAGLTDADMVHLEKFINLTHLELNVNTKITDDSLRYLSGLKKLESLSLFFCPGLNGSGLAFLADLDRLVNLNIGNNRNLTDDSLKHLQELNSLEILLASPLNGITDEGVKILAELKSLRRLRLSGEQLTDEGIQQLAALTNLEVLTLGGKQLTDDGIQRLKAAMPNCQIQK